MQPRTRGIVLTLSAVMIGGGILLTASKPVQQQAVARVNEVIALHMLSHQATDGSIASVTDRFARQGIDPVEPGTGLAVPRTRQGRDEGKRLIEEAFHRSAQTPFASGMALMIIGAGLFGLALPGERGKA